MFAVPGWSLSPALLKTEKEKRIASRRDAHDVHAANVADLWLEKVEKVRRPGSDNTSIKPNASSRKRKGHHAVGHTNSETDPLPSHEHGSGAAGKRRKPMMKDVHDPIAGNKTSPVRISGAAKHASMATATSAVSTVLRLNTDNFPTLTPLQDSMRRKLTSARFRHLNQTLYTSRSQEALQLFEANGNLFEEYHLGFRQQVSTWPENPVDTFVQELKIRGKIPHTTKGKGKVSRTEQQRMSATEKSNSPLPLPRTNGTCTVADLGCGDASLARHVANFASDAKITVLSYDLHSPHALVTKADIANLPLPDGAVDVAILCLALMGTNWIEFVEEAWRILHWKGELWIAEIKSRFGQVRKSQNETGKAKRAGKATPSESLGRRKGDEAAIDEQLMVEVDGVARGVPETDVSAFVEVLKKRGFGAQSESCVDLSNKMFVRMKFVKNASPTRGGYVKKRPDEAAQKPKKRFVEDEEEADAEAGDEASVLKPCLYKQR